MAQPFAGMLADRYGTARVLTAGALLYALGLFLMSQTSDPVTLQLTAGVLIGLGIAGCGFPLVLAAFARYLPDHLRTIGYGLGTAAGSLGQFLFAPIGQVLIQEYGWQIALMAMAALIMLIPLLAPLLRGKPAPAPVAPGQKDQSIPEALREAFRHRSYQLLVYGFFVCGFQIAFITVHLPPYLNDIGIPAIYGGYAIGLIGLFNIIGSLASGVLSARMPRRILLAGIYLGRSADHPPLHPRPAEHRLRCSSSRRRWASSGSRPCRRRSSSSRSCSARATWRRCSASSSSPTRSARSSASGSAACSTTDRQLRHRLVDLDRARRLRRARQPAHRRAPGGAAGDGVSASCHPPCLSSPRKRGPSHHRRFLTSLGIVCVGPRFRRG